MDETNKDKDRNSVRNMPTAIEKAGLRIAWLK